MGYSVELPLCCKYAMSWLKLIGVQGLGLGLQGLRMSTLFFRAYRVVFKVLLVTSRAGSV